MRERVKTEKSSFHLWEYSVELESFWKEDDIGLRLSSLHERLDDTKVMKCMCAVHLLRVNEVL